MKVIDRIKAIWRMPETVEALRVEFADELDKLARGMQHDFDQLESGAREEISDLRRDLDNETVSMEEFNKLVDQVEDLEHADYDEQIRDLNALSLNHANHIKSLTERVHDLDGKGLTVSEVM